MIYMIGGSGGPNFGDDLILSLWIRFYRQNGYLGPIVVDCLSRDASERLHKGFENVYFTSFFKKLCTGRNGDFTYYIKHGKNFVENNLDQFNNLLEKEESKSSMSKFCFGDIKLIHLYGGGYVNGVWPNSGSLLGAIAEIKNLFGVPCYATGLGISPLGNLVSEEKDALKEAISAFDLFEVRDIQTYNELSSFIGFRKEVIFGLDDCFLFPIADLVRSSSKPSIHISGFSKSFSPEDDRRVVDFFHQHREKYENIYFWVCNKSDIVLGERLQAICPEINKLTNNRLINHGAPLSKGDLMITARFHPHLIGARSGAQGYYLAQSKFYSSKHASVVDLGSPYSRMDDSALTDTTDLRNNLAHRDIDLHLRKRFLADEIISSLKN